MQSKDPLWLVAAALTTLPAIPPHTRAASMKISLVEDWRAAHRWASVRLAALGTTVTVAWNSMPDDLKALLPAALTRWLAPALLVTIVIARLLQVEDTEKEPQDASTERS